MNSRLLVSISGMAILSAVLSSAADAAPIAQAGFNDAAGINANATPNSPYTLGGPVNGAGLGEPGWSTNWFGGGTVQTSTMFEGDGAVQITPVAAMGRNLATPQTGKFSIEQYVRFAAGARLVTYTDQHTPEGEIYQGAIWQAFPDGKFYAIDGVGDGAIVAPQEFSGFTWQPNVWYKVGIAVDVAEQTWEFFVNDAKYLSPDPLGFRGTPTFLDRIRYQSEGSGPVFVDALTITPEPSTVMIMSIGVALLLVAGAKRRLTSRRPRIRTCRSICAACRASARCGPGPPCAPIRS